MTEHRFRRVIGLFFVPWLLFLLIPDAWWFSLSSRALLGMALVLRNAAALLAGFGVAWVLIRRRVNAWWVAGLLSMGLVVRTFMGTFDLGTGVARSALTIVILGGIGRGMHLVWTEKRHGAGDAERGNAGVDRADRWKKIRSRSRRGLGALLGCAYLPLLPLFFYIALFAAVDWTILRGPYLLMLAFGLVWLAILPGLGILYALRPFRFGFALVTLLALAPPTAYGVGWYMEEHDPEQIARARALARQHIEASVDEATVLETREPDYFLDRHITRALLEIADQVEADSVRARVTSGLSYVGRGSEAMAYLRDLTEETRGDPERAELHVAVCTALFDVWRRRSEWLEAWQDLRGADDGMPSWVLREGCQGSSPAPSPSPGS